VILTESNGDQPGVTMDLYRHVKSMGLRPVLCGNLKGLQDEYRTPATQVEFAKKWGQKPEMVSGFADGSKMSFEQASIANATDMRVARRGMYGFKIPPNTNLDEAVKVYPTEPLLNGPGFVDYLVGVAFPAPAVFVLATTDDPLQQYRLNLYKQGEGPLYCFFTPYHLCHLETPMSVARAVIFNDPTLTPLSGPKVEVVSIAKRDLAAGERLDGIGKFMLYGVCENATTARKENLLPIGLSEDCVLKRALPKDQAVTFDDVELPPGRLCDELWREQCERFAEELR
jgi:predicted homoserine dehydrogenase-like protein